MNHDNSLVYYITDSPQMALALKRVANLFQLNTTGKVSVEVATRVILEALPGTSKRRASILLKEAFPNGSIKRFRPGRTKDRPKPGYFYYGLELAPPFTEIPAETMVVPNIQNAIQMLETPEELANLRKEKSELERLHKEATQKLKISEADQSQLAQLKAELQILKTENNFLKQNTTKTVRESGLNQTLAASMKLSLSMLKFKNVLLGKGTFGTCQYVIYKGLPAVAKMFNNPEALSDNKLRKVVQTEAINILRLEAHPNLPMLFGVCTDSLPFCIVTQFYGISAPKSMTLFQILRDFQLKSLY